MPPTISSIKQSNTHVPRNGQGVARSATGKAYAAKHACGQAFGRDLCTVFPAHLASGQVLLFVLQQLLASTRLHSRVLGSCGCWRGDVRVCLPALTCCERLARSKLFLGEFHFP